MSAYKDETKRWRYDFEMKTRRYARRGFKTLREAKDAEAEHRRELGEGRTNPFPTFRDLAKAFLVASEHTNSEAWTKQKRWKLNAGFADLEALHPRDVTPGHIENALQRLQAAGNGGRSVNEYRKIIKTVFAYAKRMKAVIENPVDAVARIPEAAVEVSPIPVSDLKQLILAAGLVLKAVLTFMSQTGCRWIEAARLRPSDLRLDGDRPYAVLRTHKTRHGGEKVRLQPLTAIAVEAVASVRGLSADYVFPGVDGGMMKYRTEERRLKRLCDRLKLPAYSFHQIRHRVGTIAVGMGKSIKAVGQFLGHSDTTATEVYMHVADPELWAVAKRLEQEFSDVVTAAPACGKKGA